MEYAIKAFILILTLLLGREVFASEQNEQSKDLESILSKPMEARIRATYETIPLTSTKEMGVVGTHFDWFPFESLPYLYTGLGFLNAVSGEEGGFFTFGYTLGVNYNFYKDFYADTGIYIAGGSGEYIAFPNGGLLVRSHAALSYRFKKIDLVVGMSRTDFPNTIRNKEHQTDYHPYIGVNISNDIWTEVSSPDADQIASNFDGVFQNIRVSPAVLYHDIDDKKVKKDRYVGDAAYQDNFPLLGFQFDKFITDDVFFTFEAYGALSSAAGYAAIQTGLGYDLELMNNLTWETKMIVGSAGDSRIDTGGGFIVKPMTGLRFDISPSVSLKTLVGRTYAPQGRFSATTYEVGVSFSTENPVPKKGTYLFSASKFDNLKWEMNPSVKVYFPYNSEHKNTQQESEKNIGLIGITLGVPIYDYISVIGSTHWAATGNVGSYAEGLFGLKLNTDAFTPLNIKAIVQAEAGAGAGAGINTKSGGYVTQLVAGLEIPVGKNVRLGINAGEMKTSDNRFNAHTVMFSLNIDLNYLYKKR